MGTTFRGFAHFRTFRTMQNFAISESARFEFARSLRVFEQSVLRVVSIEVASRSWSRARACLRARETWKLSGSVHETLMTASNFAESLRKVSLELLANSNAHAVRKSFITVDQVRPTVNQTRASLPSAFGHCRGGCLNRVTDIVSKSPHTMATHTFVPVQVT